MVMTTHPQLIFGGSGLGESFKTVEAVTELLDTLKSNGVHTIDTAALYPIVDIGASEKLLGETGAVEHGFQVDTKILVMSADADGTLEAAKIESSVDTSLERLKLQGTHKIHVLHAHTVDNATPVKEQLAAFDKQFKKGRFEKLGVCNFPPDKLKEYLDCCEKEGFIKPTVYQGRYNLVARELEAVFPLLREHGITFNAHSPLATGFLSGSLTSGNIKGTRFEEGNMAGMMIRQQYDRKEMHDAVNTLHKLLEPAGITTVEASLRWISYHSKLSKEDGILFGASKISQINQNMEALKKGPLPEKIVSAMDDLWKTVAPQ